MGKVYDEIDGRIGEFIARQHLFFVGTAPTSLEGRLNISPKGLDTFRVLGPRSVAYLDLTGSGVETIAHLRENGRITILFCAFEGRPMILRLQGQGRVVEPDDAEGEHLFGQFPVTPGARAVIVVEVERIAESCGFAVPLYDYRGDRTQLLDFARKKGPEGMKAYRREKNARSIDGLTAMEEPGSPTHGR
ncbi:pyridoxamine 5'-phosphate oxidase family protein [Paludisphaera mucosa]|uniref:Pyridoxamine 5'-phosphate oxidase family protein n=1 Tax=Paludisphaera mucosa TaxID=3030827 RepID=A0ABT6F7J3_9BACT|nr:pyridoxamine 5'-phosphate oxidase family protein [Paludisphaera mucosa]MDG3003534.1 pyridoxamine 5'-phosphate oxidase family protein [Paludisphaera mucosa]